MVRIQHRIFVLILSSRAVDGAVRGYSDITLSAGTIIRSIGPTGAGFGSGYTCIDIVLEREVPESRCFEGIAITDLIAIAMVVKEQGGTITRVETLPEDD